MDSLARLQQRKAELKTQIEQQREGIKKTLAEARDEIEPANLLKKAVSGLLGFSKNKPWGGQPGILEKLPVPLALVAGLLVKDPKWAFLVRAVAPAALLFFSKKKGESSGKPADSDEKTEKPPEKTARAKIYGRLRQGVSALRGHLKKTEKPAFETPGTAGQTET